MTLFKGKEKNKASGKKIIRTCGIGEVFDLSLFSNDAISSKVLGEGFAVSCSDSAIASPGKGCIKDIADNGHTYAIELEDGISLLVCVSCNDKDEELEPSVEIGQTVAAGDVLCVKDNAEAAVVVTNTEKMSNYKIAYGKAKNLTDGVIVYEM